MTKLSARKRSARTNVDDGSESNSNASSSNDMKSRTEDRSINAHFEDAAGDTVGDKTASTKGEVEKFDASLIKQEDLTLKNCNKYLNAVTDTMIITVSPTMLLLTLPNTIPKNDGDGAIQANIFDFNHNDPAFRKGYEIINTMANNVFQTS